MSEIEMRQQALSEALRLNTQRGVDSVKDADSVVTDAEKFLTFLKGGDQGS